MDQNNSLASLITNQATYSGKFRVVAKILIWLIIGLVIGYFLGTVITTKKLAQDVVQVKPIFSKQSALIEGKVTKVDGRKITIRNNKGLEDTFETGKLFLVNKNTSDGKQIPDVSPNSIDLNKQLSANLDWTDDRFTISSIVYAVPYQAPPPIQISSESAQLLNSKGKASTESSKSAKYYAP